MKTVELKKTNGKTYPISVCNDSKGNFIRVSCANPKEQIYDGYDSFFESEPVLYSKKEGQPTIYELTLAAGVTQKDCL